MPSGRRTARDRAAASPAFPRPHDRQCRSGRGSTPALRRWPTTTASPLRPTPPHCARRAGNRCWSARRPPRQDFAWRSGRGRPRHVGRHRSSRQPARLPSRRQRSATSRAARIRAEISRKPPRRHAGDDTASQRDKRSAINLRISCSQGSFSQFRSNATTITLRSYFSQNLPLKLLI